MFSGWASRGACGSPVTSRDSAPVTYSAPHSGSSSPVSVASMNQSAETVTSASSRVPRNVTARTRSPSTLAATGECSSSTSIRSAERYGASIASSTATATRGSWHSELTRPAPGLRWS